MACFVKQLNKYWTWELLRSITSRDLLTRTSTKKFNIIYYWFFFSYILLSFSWTFFSLNKSNDDRVNIAYFARDLFLVSIWNTLKKNFLSFCVILLFYFSLFFFLLFNSIHSTSVKTQSVLKLLITGKFECMCTSTTTISSFSTPPSNLQTIVVCVLKIYWN